MQGPPGAPYQRPPGAMPGPPGAATSAMNGAHPAFGAPQFGAPGMPGQPFPPAGALGPKAVMDQMQQMRLNGPAPQASGVAPSMNGANGLHPPGMAPPPLGAAPPAALRPSYSGPPSTNGPMPQPLPGAAPPPGMPGVRPPGMMPGAMPPPRPLGMPPGAMPGIRPPGPPTAGAGSIPPPGAMPGMPPPPPVPGAPGAGPVPRPGMMAPPPPGGPPGFRPPMPPGMAPPPVPGMAMPGGPPPPPGMMGPPPPGGPMPGQPRQVGPPGMMGPPPPPGMAPPGQQLPPGQQQQQQQQQRAHTSNRIDPSQIPRPQARPQQETIVFETRLGNQHNVPPPASSRYVVRDRGSCSPRLMRCTMNAVPQSSELLGSAAMPLAVVCQPLALPDPADDPIQVVDLGELGPVRCSRCKAYINPYMRFTNGGRNFVCNFCSFVNNTPDAYFCPLGVDGRRQDASQRPELFFGTVEFAATAPYMIRPPMPNAHLFVIEATATAVASGALATACACISEALDAIPGSDPPVGIATFDNAVHFYSLRPGQSQPQMLVMSDTAEPFAPNSAPLLVGAASGRQLLQDLLAQLPELHAGARATDSCGCAAAHAAVEALKQTGGRVHLFLASLPTSGAHGLKVRDQLINDRTDKVKLEVLGPAGPGLKTLATMAAEFQVTVDVSLLSTGYMDTASLQELTNTTCGTLYSYHPFSAVANHDQVLNDLRWNVSRQQGLEAVMRLRCSSGLDLDGYYGTYAKRVNNKTDIDLPAIDCDKAIVVKLTHVDKLSGQSECYFQNALLYTTTSGARRVRVSTLALPVTDNVSQVFKTADLDANVTYIVKRLASSLPQYTLSVARELVQTTAVGILHAYRKYCATNSSAVQLILPEALKLLPLYALGLLKGPALRSEVRLDDRATALAHALALPAGRLGALLYPRLIAVHKLLGDPAPLAHVPDSLQLSAEVLEAGGIYLLENGMEALVYFDKQASPQALKELLGVGSYEELLKLPAPPALLPMDTPASAKLQELLQRVRLERCAYMRLAVVRKGDPLESVFFSGLVEDRSAAGQSYVEYLCAVHRNIQNKMSS